MIRTDLELEREQFAHRTDFQPEHVRSKYWGCLRSSSKSVPSKTFVISTWNRCIQVRRTRLAFEVVFTMRKYRFNTGPIRPNLEYHIVLTQECSAPGEIDKNRALNSRKPHKIVPNCCQMAPWRQLRHVLAPNLRKIQNLD